VMGVAIFSQSGQAYPPAALTDEEQCLPPAALTDGEVIDA